MFIKIFLKESVYFQNYMMQMTCIRLSILSLGHCFKSLNENGDTTILTNKEKEVFYKSLGKQFMECNKTNNFFLCFRQFYSTTEKSSLKMKRSKLLIKRQNLYKAICIFCMILLIGGCRKPIKVLSLSPSCCRKEGCTCIKTCLRTSTHKILFQPGF